LLKRLGIGGAGVLGTTLPVGSYFVGVNNGEHQLQGNFSASVSAGERLGRVNLWWSVDADSKVIALTFDDGPTTQFTGQVLDILARHDVPATFFLIGEQVRRHPDLVRRIIDEGHLVANHTYDHYSAAVQSPSDVQRTVERGANAIASISGERPRWFRPVRGHITGALMQAVADAGHEMLMWSVSRGEAAAADDVTAVREHYIETIHEGAVVIFHDGIGRSAFELTGPDDLLMTARRAEITALPAVIDRYLADGYTFLSASALVDRSLPRPPENSSV
jgi:peptidoglycan/xylan/chitin deacetylase (PgdA/CDA1 family)